MNTIRRVTDESGVSHTLSKKLGAGGQGEVWLTEGGRRIVKLLNDRHNAGALRRQLAFVKRLGLEELHVAKPLAVLRPPHIGYVAEFLDEMVPLKTLMEAPGSGLLQWYIDTGGLRRRLRLLAHAGEALCGLHAHGVVYADMSHHNVFVSAPLHAAEAWLIDLDNLSHDSDPKRAIYTPGYGAPEIVTGAAGCTSFSDAWAFAVLVWRTLTLTHPFIGDLVNDGEPELEEEALAGRLPWIEHSHDSKNRCSSGLPPAHVLAQKLSELARKTFEDGVEQRQERSSVSAWVERLHTAADQTVRCTECSGTFFVTEPVCPWCEATRPQLLPVRIARWQPGRGIVDLRLGQQPLTRDEGLVLTRRVTEGLSGLSGRTPHIEMNVVERGVSVRTFAGRTAWVAPTGNPGREHHEVLERERIIPQNGWMVFFEAPDKPQRVVLIGRPV